MRSWKEAESDGGELLEEKLAQRSQAMEIHKVLHRLSEPYKEGFFPADLRRA